MLLASSADWEGDRIVHLEPTRYASVNELPGVTLEVVPGTLTAEGMALA